MSVLHDGYIAFIDILGFRSVVSRLTHDIRLQTKFHDALVRLKRQEVNPGEFAVTAFSDSIVISTNTENGDSLVWKCASLQAEMLFSGIMLRGGVSRGPVFHADGIVYGTGMVNAYDIESKMAGYPRIVIDPDCVDAIRSVRDYKTLLLVDEDGLTRVNPFFSGFEIWGFNSYPDEREDDRNSMIEECKRQLGEQISVTSDKGALVKMRWLMTKLVEARSMPYVEIW